MSRPSKLQTAIGSIGDRLEERLEALFKEISAAWATIEELEAKVRELEEDNSILTNKVKKLEELVYIPPTQSGYVSDSMSASAPYVTETVAAAPAHQ